MTNSFFPLYQTEFFKGSTIAKIVAENTKAHPDIFEEGVRIHTSSLQAINKVHENVKYLPDITLPDNVVANPDLPATVKDATLLVFNLPHQFISQTLDQIKGHHLPYARGISCIKGVDVSDGSVTLYSELIMEKLGSTAVRCLGPTSPLRRRTEEYHRPGRRVVVGKGWGENGKAAIIRLGVLEMVRFGRYWFPKSVEEKMFTEESAGIADLVASCNAGRNFRSACHAAERRVSVDEIEKTELNGQMLQGTLTAYAVRDFLAKNDQLGEFPLFVSVHGILKGSAKIDDLPALISKNRAMRS
ncbi:NAD-dependent glycerol-3-phosphate dehydrogenase [Aspergillus affinis]|uniref:NAD-dependent glycerol-3-phosphate dehydrogenase n=1 Tax=Aspergillus affinis TaxID=1070780 RepID=UPI0022FE3384|nr:NAD-dependent glycerol-3-phosphate dehydrogenase [Aspergillus affinis]KAI9035684.1 NAD-dependent glycerol-3-phosphate dehydrogenase [Aspergillus affinis]